MTRHAANVRLNMPKELTTEQVERYRRTGVLHLENAFPADVALALQDQVWAWASRFGVVRDDPSTWWTSKWGWAGTAEFAKRLRSRDMKSERLTRAVDDLLGEGTWTYPDHFGALLITPPDRDPRRWTVGGRGWHWDGAWRGELFPRSRVNSFHLLGEIGPHGGGTLLVEGSHVALHDFHQTLGPDADVRKRKARWNLLVRSHSFFGALDTEGAPDDPERFLEPDAALRVVEVTGNPGDVWFWHPLLVHRRPAHHHGAVPRFQALRGFDPPRGSAAR